MIETHANYRFERLSKDNIHHLKTLFRLVFHKRVSLDFILDKYNTEYLGKSFLGHIAFDKDKPIAYGGFVPYRIQYKDIIEIGAQSVDSMSTKEVRGKGLFSIIGQMNELLLIKEGINFGYGFANQNSEPVIVKKLGWTIQSRMMVFVIRIKTIPYAKIIEKFGLKQLNQQKIIINKYKTEEPFFSPFNDSESGFTVYDSDFMRYKSFTNNYVILANGIKVWAKVNETLSIGNIDYCSKEKFITVIDHLKIITRKMGLNQILLQFSPNTFQAKYLLEHYEPIMGSAIIFKPFSTSIPLDKILFSNADIDTF